MKKIFSAILAVLLVTLLLTSAVALPADPSAVGAGRGLRFNDDGQFKILYVTDVQDVYPMKQAMIQFLNEALDATQPDLVIFGGDNIVTPDVRAYEQMLTPLIERNIKFSLVLGNHDSECSNMTPEQILEEYQKYPGCLAFDEVPALHGCGTHNLEVKSSDGSKTAFNIWLFDSGAYATFADGTSGYDCVRADQVEWYVNRSKELQAANGGALVPSLAFQHIIVAEVFEAMYFRTPNLGKASRNFSNGVSYSIVPNPLKVKGILQEIPCPSMDNEGQWDAFVERCDVMGCATGHDHTNSFVVDYKGVDIIQCAGSSYESYGNDNVRGATLFTVYEDWPFYYELERVTAADLAVKPGSELPGLSEKSLFDYHLGRLTFRLYLILTDLVELINVIQKQF